uniref:Uncharacterized protein n=1 Tax=Romanomermis culicivorax TaxID=13658 RepID=A0A915IEQ1_ROMCU
MLPGQQAEHDLRKNSSRNSEKTSPIIHSRSESITAILRKTTHGNVQLNRNERKFPYRSVTFGILHSDSSSSVGKDKYKRTLGAK